MANWLITLPVIIDQKIFNDIHQRCLPHYSLSLRKSIVKYMIDNKIKISSWEIIVKYCIRWTLRTFYSFLDINEDIPTVIHHILAYDEKYFKESNQNQLFKQHGLEIFLPKVRELSQQFMYKRADVINTIIIVLEHIIQKTHFIETINTLDPLSSLLIIFINLTEFLPYLKFSYSVEIHEFLYNGIELFESEYYENKVRIIKISRTYQ